MRSGSDKGRFQNPVSSKVVVVALEHFCRQDGRPREVLQEAGFQVHENTRGRQLRPEEMRQMLGDADAVLADLEPYDASLLAQLPRLRCISRCGTGTDSIDLEAARRREIAVLTTPDEVVEPTAQMAVAMILALARNLPLHQADLRQGNWEYRDGFLLSEWTIGLIGFGRIGRAVEGYLRPFGPQILVADPVLRPEECPSGASLCALEALLPQVDLVSLHARRARSEGPLIGRREFALLKRGSRLVNTARGYLVDEEGLYEALVAGHLSSAALDVFETEPYSGPLLRLPQVLATPHVSTFTRVSRARMELRCARNVVEFFDSK